MRENQEISWKNLLSCLDQVGAIIRATIPPIQPHYTYPGEQCINPGYENLGGKTTQLKLQEKRIWVLRSDLILATGVKNAYEKEYGYTGFKEAFEEVSYPFINFNDRYGHPSLAFREETYDGSVFYAGYLCKRRDFLQVYLASGRFERTDLNEAQTALLEAYIAAHFQLAFGSQTIIFECGNSADPSYHATFFGNGLFAENNPRRIYHTDTLLKWLEALSDISLEESYPAPQALLSGVRLVRPNQSM